MPNFPIIGGVVPTVAALAIMIALFPEMPMRHLLLPIVGSVAFAGAFYILLMPHLSSFLGLGTGIFLAIFLICVVFARPDQMITQTLGTATFVMVISVSDQQSYSATYVMNFGLMWLLAMFAVAASAWSPISFAPDRVIGKQFRRFVSSCDRLAEPQPTGTRHRCSRIRHALDLHEVAVLPGRIRRWFKALQSSAYGSGTPAQADELTDGMQALGDRMRELVELRDAPQSSLVARELSPDMRAWRVGIQEALCQLVTDPGCLEEASLRKRLEDGLTALEGRIEGLLNGAPDGAVSAEELQNMYRLLGAYRGVSEAILNLVRLAAGIDWARLREARF